MTQADPQPEMRLLHVCADPAAGDRVAAAARSAGLASRRFDDAFAAASWLLDAAPAPTVLLLAVDGLAKIELDICRWAPGHGPVTVWIHGDRGRLNGQAGNAAIRVIELPQLADLLGAWRDGATPLRTTVVSAPAPETINTAASPDDTDEPDAPAINAELEARLQTLIDEPEAKAEAEPSGPFAEQPAAPTAGPGDAVLTADELESLAGDDDPCATVEEAEAEDSPPLRLHPAADQPDESLVLTAAEIEALLGDDDEEADRGQG